MKRSTIAFYVIAFTLLTVVFFLFVNAYRELTHYSSLVNRRNAIYTKFQNLSVEINKAAVINPDLLAAGSGTPEDNLFFTDSQAVIRQVDSLSSAVRDTLNVRIAHQLDTLMKAELPWLLFSNVPDSIAHHRSAAHIAKLKEIDQLVRQGLDRNMLLLVLDKQELQKAIDQMIIWMVLFIILAVIAIVYSIIKLSRQKAITADKQKQLDKTETTLRHTLDNMLEGVQIIGYDYRYTYVNNALVRQSQYTREQLMGPTISELYPGVESTELYSLIRQCMTERTAHHLESIFTFPSGDVSYFELSIQPVPEGVFILSVDITERKKAQEALHKSEMHHRMLVEQAADGIFVSDTQGHFIMVNIAGCAMLGYSHGEMMTLEITDIIDEGDAARVPDELARLLDGKIITSEASFKRKDGSLFPGELIARVLPDGSIQAIVRDVTEQKKAKEHLIKANRLYAFISAINKTIVHTKNEKELFDRVCEIAVNIGRFRLAWIGMLDDDDHLQVMKTCGDENAANAINMISGSDYSGPMLRYTFIGRMFWTSQNVVINDIQTEPTMILWKKEMLDIGVKSVIALPLKKFGKTIGLFCLNSETEETFDKDEIALLEEAAGDISFALEISENEARRRRAEEEIKELNENLETRIAERTTELTEANNALESFSYSVSHDLRAPLRAMIGFTRIIQEEYGTDFNADLNDMFDHIVQSSKKMNDIIDNMLMLAKYEKEKLQPAIVDMNALFKAVWDYISLASPHKACIQKADLPAVEADSSMLQQVITNLLSNAIKYSSKKDAPVVEVGYERSHDLITFFVRDNGAGFDMKNYARLFGAFQRLHSASDFEGTGVGLLLAKKIIERHGGEIWAEGKVGEGAIFYFSLPCGSS